MRRSRCRHGQADTDGSDEQSSCEPRAGRMHKDLLVRRCMPWSAVSQPCDRPARPLASMRRSAWCASSKWTRPEAVELASPARAPNSRPVGPARSLRRGRLIPPWQSSVAPRWAVATHRHRVAAASVQGIACPMATRDRWRPGLARANATGPITRARHPPAVLRLACCADRPRWATTSCRSAATVNTASTAWEGEDTASRTSSRTTATIRPALAAISREST